MLLCNMCSVKPGLQPSKPLQLQLPPLLLVLLLHDARG
jgi:hypothetical protein